MIAVIFEVIPTDEGYQNYLSIAEALKPNLVKIDGFISIERFSSLAEEGKVLSLSFWRDEEAIERWRNLEAHRIAQTQGRKNFFKDYRLRVASVIRDYGMNDRKEAPKDSLEIHR